MILLNNWFLLRCRGWGQNCVNVDIGWSDVYVALVWWTFPDFTRHLFTSPMTNKYNFHIQLIDFIKYFVNHHVLFLVFEPLLSNAPFHPIDRSTFFLLKTCSLPHWLKLSPISALFITNFHKEQVTNIIRKLIPYLQNSVSNHQYE